ncbi:hypothetical protein H6P81_009826 [Aristolochia fimbriata]|uniref:Uncharacterized protein n=1 Tax=Aristolochia fimbriata TaxID=158543 RepID=A0AAV7EPP5_ARIFI|nr:hypothetical protein H6P81_009826 [Aristolochia fimbriata]
MEREQQSDGRPSQRSLKSSSKKRSSEVVEVQINVEKKREEEEDGITAEEKASKEPEEAESMQMTDVVCLRCTERKVGVADIIQHKTVGVHCMRQLMLTPQVQLTMTAWHHGQLTSSKRVLKRMLSPRDSEKPTTDNFKKSTVAQKQPLLETHKSFNRGRTEDSTTKNVQKPTPSQKQPVLEAQKSFNRVKAAKEPLAAFPLCKYKESTNLSNTEEKVRKIDGVRHNWNVLSFNRKKNYFRQLQLEETNNKGKFYMQYESYRGGRRGGWKILGGERSEGEGGRFWEEKEVKGRVEDFGMRKKRRGGWKILGGERSEGEGGRFWEEKESRGKGLREKGERGVGNEESRTRRTRSRERGERGVETGERGVENEENEESKPGERGVETRRTRSRERGRTRSRERGEQGVENEENEESRTRRTRSRERGERGVENEENEESRTRRTRSRERGERGVENEESRTRSRERGERGVRKWSPDF